MLSIRTAVELGRGVVLDHDGLGREDPISWPPALSIAAPWHLDLRSPVTLSFLRLRLYVCSSYVRHESRR
jgi:hypothetical protein